MKCGESGGISNITTTTKNTIFYNISSYIYIYPRLYTKVCVFVRVYVICVCVICTILHLCRTGEGLFFLLPPSFFSFFFFFSKLDPSLNVCMISLSLSLSFSLLLLLPLLDRFTNSQLRSMGSASSVTEDDDEEEDEDASSLSCFFVADLSATNALT